MPSRRKKSRKVTRIARRTNHRKSVAGMHSSRSSGMETAKDPRNDENLTVGERGLVGGKELLSTGSDRVQNKTALVKSVAEEKLNVQPRDSDTLVVENSQERRSLEERVLAVVSQESEITRIENELVGQKAKLEKREAEVFRREYEAEEGFAAKRRETSYQLDKEREQLREEWKTRHGRLQEQERKLDGREEQLANEKRKLDSEIRLLEYEQQDSKELQDDLRERAKQLAAARIEELEHRVQSVMVQLEQARKDRDKYLQILNQHQETDRKCGQRTLEEIVNENDSLRQQNDQLNSSLAQLPDANAGVRLAALEKEQETWQAERIELMQQKSELHRRLAYSDNDSNEREVQRDYIESLNSQRKLLFKANEDLRLENDKLFRAADSRIPFPACTSMDSNFESSTPKSSDIGSIESFVEYLQHQIAKPESLYYSLPDLRSFVGGLAMGRLIILQGVSGTGKTSLPVEFARAVGTEPSVIEVQAGWRDPQDLMGHYNSFEKQFNEKEFLQALYKAHTPQWRDAIIIVLLDEMNLSHPEQYFSDLLSAMEFPTERQRLVLMSHAVDPAPREFIEGSKLSVPQNVWFVGTANHDETTMSFAPKTYDRAHVMELPLRPESFQVKSTKQKRISFRALRHAFEEASKKHSVPARNAIDFLRRN